LSEREDKEIDAAEKKIMVACTRGSGTEMPYMHLITVCEDFSKEKSSCRRCLLWWVITDRCQPVCRAFQGIENKHMILHQTKTQVQDIRSTQWNQHRSE